MEEKKIPIIKRRKLIMALYVFIALIVLVATVALSINCYVKSSTKANILSVEQASELKDVDCILVLGCGVWDNDVPSPMLKDRLLRSIDLYKSESAPKILMTGDHGQVEYDEVNVMKQFAIDRGVPSEDIFMDHAGFSTYESMYRAVEIFQAKKVVIVTQDYHLNRALYIAEKLGLDAYGVAADQRKYSGQAYRDAREILARNKDFVKVIFQPKPTYLGDVIPVNGNGDATNDRNIK